MSPVSSHIIPKFYTMDAGRGTCNGNGSDNAGTKKILHKLEMSWSLVGSQQRPWPLCAS